MAEEKSKRILYIHDYSSGIWALHEATNAVISINTGGMMGLFYWQARKELDAPLKTLAVETEEVFGVLSKHKSLDLIVIQPELNKHLDLTRKIREQKLTDAKIVLYPLPKKVGETKEILAESGADFGIEIFEFDKVENIAGAFTNILRGKVGGYVFNSKLYKDESGTLVPATESK